jgi:NAD(P)-dependent dehydrogenase (short-subunit alcohol dehydrogenase family)
MGRLDGKVAVITGAASGMGRAASIRFAQEGAAVVVADLNSNGGEETVAECKKTGGRAVFQRVDVMNEADIKGAVDRAVTEFGKLDVIFNNAGLGGALGKIEETTVENWDRTQAILLRAVFLGMKHAIPAIRKAGGGSIISTASIAGLQGGAGPHSYSAAKAAVVNLTKSVAIEVGPDNIRVNCICPGGINTPLIFNNVCRRLRGRGPAPQKAAAHCAGWSPGGHRGYGIISGQRRVAVDYGHRDGRGRRLYRGWHVFQRRGA